MTDFGTDDVALDEGNMMANRSGRWARLERVKTVHVQMWARERIAQLSSAHMSRWERVRARQAGRGETSAE